MLDTTKRELEKEYKERKKGFFGGSGWSKKKVIASKMKLAETDRKNAEVKKHKGHKSFKKSIVQIADEKGGIRNTSWDRFDSLHKKK